MPASRQAFLLLVTGLGSGWETAISTTCGPRNKIRAVLVLVVCVSSALGSAADPPSIAGLPLAEALAELQQQGLAIVFSSALLRPEMLVREEPREREPRAILDEILRPHGLEVHQGPGEQLVVVQSTSPPIAPRTGAIRGRVQTDGETALLAGVTIGVMGTEGEAAPSDDGSFAIYGLAPGEYIVQAESASFLPQRIERVRVREDEVTWVRFQLVPASVFLSEIVVTPSHFKILQEQPESRQFLSREEVDQMPHVADDLYRAVKRLPGATGSDFSATFNIRGGVDDEVLVLLDGLELYEPFHLKDFQNMFSTVDAEAVAGVDFLTGGFPAEYGDRMSGVMDIAVETPAGPSSTSLALSTLNGRFMSQGTFNSARGQWLVSGRGWYPDAVLELVGATSGELLSDYYDVLGKVQHSVGSHSTLSANLLLGWDDLGFATADLEQAEEVRASYRSHHLWLNMKTRWSDSLFSQTVLSGGQLKRQRNGSNVDADSGSYRVDDDRAFEFFGLKQDWTLELGDRQVLKWGFDVKHHEASYDYTSTSSVTVPMVGLGQEPPEQEVVIIDLEPAGESYGMYLANRIRLSERLVAEVGLRWDRQFWIEDDQTSPRFNLMYTAGAHTTLRAAWGLFHQSQRLNELQVEDGVSDFFPAQLAEQWLIGVEHVFPGGLLARAEAHWKEYDELRPRYENPFNPIELFPESGLDRVRVAPDRGRARGLELLLKRGAGSGAVAWWISYALSRAEDPIDGGIVPRSWDQRHTAGLGLNLSLPRGWNVNLAGIYHTGWPTTPATGELMEGEEGQLEPVLVIGERNSVRYPDYLRLDLRASKVFTTRHGEISLIFEAINLTNRKNVCCIEDFELVVEDDGTVLVVPEEGSWPPIIPSIGVRWRF